MELSILKRDRGMLLAVLGIPAAGQHLKCPFHGGGENFSVWAGEDGVWLWKCHSRNCGSGTIIDAAMLKYNASNCQAAIQGIERDLGVSLIKDEEYIEPRIDQARAQEFCADAQKNLVDDVELQEKWLKKKRGLSLETAVKYRLGFADGWRMKGNSWNIFGWVLPITDAAGRLVFVKLHTERPPWPDGPKALSAPFGTYPEKKPKHGTNLLWPAPELFGQVDKLYLAPGELKALALINAGFAATSPTTGENKMPERMIERIKKCQPGTVFVVFDNDAKKLVNNKWVSKGCEWRDSMLAALTAAGVSAHAFCYKDKKHEGSISAPSAPPVKPAVPAIGREPRQESAGPGGNLPTVGAAEKHADQNQSGHPLSPEKEWERLEDKILQQRERNELAAELIGILATAGKYSVVSPEATIEDLRAMIRAEIQIEAATKSAPKPGDKDFPRFHRKPIGKCRT